MITKKIPKEKSLSKLKSLLQEVFNKYIRLRDSVDGHFKCISCGEFKDCSQMNAGHFHPVSTATAIRFCEFNVNGQCIRCNHYLSGNLLEYKKGLIAKYGPEIIELLEVRKHNVSKMGKFEISILIQEYKEKVKQFEKLKS